MEAADKAPVWVGEWAALSELVHHRMYKYNKPIKGLRNSETTRYGFVTVNIPEMGESFGTIEITATHPLSSVTEIHWRMEVKPKYTIGPERFDCAVDWDFMHEWAESWLNEAFEHISYL